jgi:hypothetical protein
MVIPIIRRFFLALASAALVVPVAACSGPSGVELGRNWAGSEIFVLARVNDQTTVVGIDPERHTAEPLVVVPSQSDDDEILSPRITRLADGRWVISIPKNGGRPSRLYLVNAKDHILDALGTVEGNRMLVPAGKSAVAITDKSLSGTGKANALVYDSATWQVERSVDLPIDPAVASGGPAGLCVGNVSDDGTQVALAALGEGSSPELHRIPGVKAQGLDCTNGRPVVASGPEQNGESAASSPTLRLTTIDGTDVVAASAGRVDRIRGTATSIVAAVSLPGHVELVELSRDKGQELHRVRIKGLSGVKGLRETPERWVLSAGSSAVTVNLQSGEVKTFKLPGELLDAG